MQGWVGIAMFILTASITKRPFLEIMTTLDEQILY